MQHVGQTAVAQRLPQAQHRVVVNDVHHSGNHPVRVPRGWLGGLPPNQSGGQGLQQGPLLLRIGMGWQFNHRGGLRDEAMAGSEERSEGRQRRPHLA